MRSSDVWVQAFTKSAPGVFWNGVHAVKPVTELATRIVLVMRVGQVGDKDLDAFWKGYWK